MPPPGGSHPWFPSFNNQLPKQQLAPDTPPSARASQRAEIFGPPPPPALRSPEQRRDDTLYAIHRLNFMKTAYGVDLTHITTEAELEKFFDDNENSFLEPKGTGTKVLTPAKWNRRVYALKHWETGADGLNKVAFKKAYSDCKNLAIKSSPRYHVVETTEEGVDLLYRVIEYDKETKQIRSKKRVVHILETFDIIREHHVDATHFLSDTTKNKIDNAGFYNITLDEVKAYCRTCPTCNKKRKAPSHVHQGAKYAIKSWGFFELVQMDLIDYRMDPQKGIDNITYNWLLVLKDHFNRFLILQALPTKESKHVAQTLCYIFNLFGYPLIVQCDNGKEFKGEVKKLIAEIQNRDSKCTTIINGQPRTPRHQGSVERSNRDVKTNIAKDVDHKRMLVPPAERSKISWLTEYPRTMAAYNSSCKTRRKNDASPYFLVFGREFDNPLHGAASKEELRKRTTVSSRARILGSEYKEKMIQLKQIDSDGRDALEQCYDSDLESAPAEMEEALASEEAAISRSSSNVDANDTISLSYVDAVVSPPIKQEDQKLPPIQKPTNNAETFNGFDVSREVVMPLKHAWLRRDTGDFFNATVSIPRFPGMSSSQFIDKHGFTYLTFECNGCRIDGRPARVSLGDEAYYQKCSNSNRWLEVDFVTSFALLAGHAFHRPDVYVMVASMSDGTGKQTNANVASVVTLNEGVDEVLCVALERSHFAVLHILLKLRKVVIYDGLAFNPAETWKPHIRMCLERLGFPVEDQSHFQASVDSSLYPQHDFSSCGPIGCGVAWEILSETGFKVAEHSHADLRSLVVEQYQFWIKQMEDVLLYKRLARKNIGGLYTENELSSKNAANDQTTINQSKKEDAVVLTIEDSPPTKNKPMISGNKTTGRPSIEEALNFLECYDDELPPAADFASPKQEVPNKKQNTSTGCSVSDKRSKEVELAKRERINSREKSISLSRARQDEQAKKMENLYKKVIAEVKVGMVAQVKVDAQVRSRCNPLNPIAVIFEASSKNSSFKLATEYGILGYGSPKQSLWLPPDQFTVLRDEDNPTISTELAAIRKAVLNGTFVEKEHKQISLKEAHERSIGHSAGDSNRCGCSASNRRRPKCSSNICSCTKNGNMCHSGCACNGNCGNPNNP